MDNEYTDAQVGDAGGLFKSLDPIPCGAVPAYLIECSSSSPPDPLLQIQSTSSSTSDPIYLIHCCSSSLPHPVLQFQSTSPVQKTLISLVVYFCFCTFFFFQISLFLNYYYTIIYTTILFYFKCNVSYFIYYTLFCLYYYTTIVTVTSCVSDFTQ